MGRKLGGRAYLVSRLGELGISRRQAKRIVNMVFDEISRALRRGESVEFPFGYLKAKKGRRSETPLTIEHIPDDEGWKLLEGEKLVPAAAGWSLPPDKRSFANLWTPKLKPVKKPERVRTRRQRLNKWSQAGI
jgi:nucleoid DNA-binding protein